MLRWILATLVVMTLVGSANAGILEDAEAAAKLGNWPKAIKLWRAGTFQGDPQAKYYLGRALMNGRGGAGPEVLAEAGKLIQQSAEQGHAGAQYTLGTMYEKGSWGVTADGKEAMRWWNEAAARGHPGAQRELGFLYEAGQGVPADLIQAFKWFYLADSVAPESDVRETRVDRMIGKMNPEQISEAYKLIKTWRPK